MHETVFSHYDPDGECGKAALEGGSLVWKKSQCGNKTDLIICYKEQYTKYGEQLTKLC